MIRSGNLGIKILRTMKLSAYRSVKKTVNHVIVVYDFAYVNGGQARVAIESAVGLALEGLQVTYFAACGPVDERLMAAGVEVVCLGQKDILGEPNRIKAIVDGIWNFKAARELRRLLISKPAAGTIVHCHGLSKALSASIGPVLTETGCRHVFTCHEYFLACPNGGFYDFGSDSHCERKPMGVDCLISNCDSRSAAHKAWRVLRQGVQISLGHLPAKLRNIIYISETQRDILGPYFPGNARLEFLPNPVEVDVAGERICAEENDIFLFVGRISPEKGAVSLARAAKLAGVKAVFLGDGPDMAAVKTENPAAEMLGWVASADVKAWMQKSRCLVLPSIWAEPFGLVAYDALARGLPVIAGRWTATAEAIRHGHTGLIFDRRDDLQRQLELMTPACAELCSRNSFAERANLGLSLEAHTRRLVEIYESI